MHLFSELEHNSQLQTLSVAITNLATIVIHLLRTFFLGGGGRKQQWCGQSQDKLHSKGRRADIEKATTGADIKCVKILSDHVIIFPLA